MVLDMPRGPGNDEQWDGTLSWKPKERWNNTSENTLKELPQSGQPDLPLHELLIQRSTQKQKWWKVFGSPYFAVPQTAELQLRTIIAGNQLSITEQWRNGATARTRWNLLNLRIGRGT